MVHAVRPWLFGIAALFLVAAAVMAVAGDSTAGKAVALTLFGVACVIAVSLVFLAIGRSEDAERERSAPKPPAPDPHAGEAERRSRPRPPRRPS
jgi:quinol-cytochrome oxidoreductase complex cytochrome b subunit